MRDCKLFTARCRDVTLATFCERSMPKNAVKTCGQRAVKRS
jgi:hypothetical protein